ncbi:hypothetical protein TL16_g02103 [Triparma laevis f. inornata]|uniref:Protein kinase domain-containing protein n=1 Tax=Triparma laevis f. inornata TaxID=1714386 RepID=A0A9W6ZTI2_9STRA|nr:hypothetical protein TL16_g02103 [Triparma laevis f. inornata]
MKGGTHCLSSCAGQEDMTFKPLGMSLIDIPPINNSSFENMVLSCDEVSQISVYQLRMTCESCLNILELLNSTLGDCTNLVTGMLSVNNLNQGRYCCNVIIEGEEEVLQDFAITLSGSPQVSEIEHKAMTTGFVFKVSDSFDGSSHIMKETTCMETSEKKNTLNEYKIIKEIHKKGNVPGVVLTPIMFEEDVRSSMIYKMYKMDLFNFLGIYCKKHRVGGVPESMAVVWLAQLLISLRVLVNTNIIHRDLKLENILLDEFSNVVMTDFELAHQFSDTSNPPQGRNVEIVGTPMYIAPEVGKQEVVDLQKNDIWSLGVIAWELVCETNPWGLFVDKMHPSKIMEHTNNSKGPGPKPKFMSDQYYNFVCNLIQPRLQRFTVEQAMNHQIFKDIDFDNVDTLFPKKMPHAELMCNVEFLDDNLAQQQPQDGNLRRTSESRGFCRSLEKRPRISGHELSSTVTTVNENDDVEMNDVPTRVAKSALQREYSKFKVWQRQQKGVFEQRNKLFKQNLELKAIELKAGMKERAEFLSDAKEGVVGATSGEGKKRGAIRLLTERIESEEGKGAEGGTCYWLGKATRL